MKKLVSSIITVAAVTGVATAVAVAAAPSSPSQPSSSTVQGQYGPTTVEEMRIESPALVKQVEDAAAAAQAKKDADAAAAAAAQAKKDYDAALAAQQAASNANAAKAAADLAAAKTALDAANAALAAANKAATDNPGEAAAPKPGAAKAGDVNATFVPKKKKNKKLKTLAKGDAISITGVSKVIYGVQIEVTDCDGTKATLTAGNGVTAKLKKGVLTFSLTTTPKGKGGDVKGVDSSCLSVTSIRGAYKA